MYKLVSPKVYITQEVLKDKSCTERMNRMMKNIKAKKIKEISDQERENLIKSKFGVYDVDSLVEIRKGVRGIDPNLDDTEIMFDKVEFPKEDFSWDLYNNGFLQLTEYALIRDTKAMLEKGEICQNGLHLLFANGCFHQCAYCFLTRAVRIFLNLEEYPIFIDKLINKYPQNTLFFADGETDIMCFEPEYGVSEMLINYFAQKEGKYINLTTKSANVDHLLNLEHRGNAIISWTISCDSVCQLEQKAPPLKQRLKAMRKCQEAGYIVRCRFSPIIPFKNWKEENIAMIEQLFQAAQPDVITIQPLLSNETSFSQFIDQNQIDEEYWATDSNFKKAEPGGPIKFDKKLQINQFIIKEIKRRSPKTHIALCCNSPKMWKELEGEISGTPEKFICNCGNLCNPGTKLYEELVTK